MKRWGCIVSGVLAFARAGATQCSVRTTDPNWGIGTVSRLSTPQGIAGTASMSNLAINVKDCGAKGDGVADDTPALTAAINAAQSVAPGAAIGNATVFVPPGTYRFSATYDITKPIIIQGVPGGASTLQYTGSGTAIIWEHAMISGGTQITQYAYGPGIRDIVLQGPGAATASTIGLLCGNNNATAGTMGAAFWNLKIMQFRIAFQGANGCDLISAINNIYVNDSIALYLPSGASKAGEGLAWEHCTFANSAKKATGTIIGNGWEVAFMRCSFDNSGLLDSSTSIVTCLACHFENPGATLNYDMLTVQNGFFNCYSCLFSNDDRAAADSQFIEVNGTNATLLSVGSIFENTAGSRIPIRAVEVSLGKHVTLIGSVLNSNSLTREWDLGASQATFGVESFGAFNPGVPFGQRQTLGVLQNLKYSTSINPDASRANAFVITVTNGTAFTINAPTRPPNGGYQRITFDIFNSSGGAMGAITWAGGANGFRLAGAFPNPMTSKHRLIEFQFNPSTGAWYEVSRSAADIAN